MNDETEDILDFEDWIVCDEDDDEQGVEVERSDVDSKTVKKPSKKETVDKKEKKENCSPCPEDSEKTIHHDNHTSESKKSPKVDTIIGKVNKNDSTSKNEMSRRISKNDSRIDVNPKKILDSEENSDSIKNSAPDMLNVSVSKTSKIDTGKGYEQKKSNKSTDLKTSAAKLEQIERKGSRDSEVDMEKSSDSKTSSDKKERRVIKLISAPSDDAAKEKELSDGKKCAESSASKSRKSSHSERKFEKRSLSTNSKTENASESTEKVGYFFV